MDEKKLTITITGNDILTQNEGMDPQDYFKCLCKLLVDLQPYVTTNLHDICNQAINNIPNMSNKSPQYGM